MKKQKRRFDDQGRALWRGKDPLEWLMRSAIDEQEKHLADIVIKLLRQKYLEFIMDEFDQAYVQFERNVINEKHGSYKRHNRVAERLKEYVHNVMSDKAVLGLFSFKQDVETICEALPNYMNEEQQQKYSIAVRGGYSNGKLVATPIARNSISQRLGAGGLRDLANQASQIPSGAGGHSPKERSEFRQPKRRP